MKDAITVLLDYEEMIREGRIAMFHVTILDSGLLVQTDGSDEDKKLVPITRYLQASLSTFFHGVDSITCPSFDYNTLKSLINAHTCISRITNKGAR